MGHSIDRLATMALVRWNVRSHFIPVRSQHLLLTKHNVILTHNSKTDREWRAIVVTLQVLGWVGIVSLWLVLVPFLVIQERRQQPLVSITCLLISESELFVSIICSFGANKRQTGLMPLAIASLMPSLHKFHIVCRSHTEASTYKYVPCAIQCIAF